jgi:hypothetical protein
MLRICKLRNGVTKPLNFFFFSQVKGGTKTVAHLSIARDRVFKAYIGSFMIVN